MMRDRADPGTVQLHLCRYGRMASIRGDQYMGRALARYGEYSEGEVELWRQLLAPDAIVADVGANIGAHTVALAQMVPQGGVFAFEPLRFTFGVLWANVVLNGLTNVVPIHAAVGAAPGQLLTPAIDYTREDNYGGCALHPGAVTHGNPVPVVRLDDILPAVHLIKADVEGMELEVLRGAARLIAECRPILYVEANAGPTQAPLLAHLAGLGYDRYWHKPPHYNPENWNRARPESLELLRIVSFNVLALPAEGPLAPALRARGLEPIPRPAVA